MPRYATPNAALTRSFLNAWRAEGLAEVTGTNYVRHLNALSEATGKGLLDITRADLEERTRELITSRSAATAHTHVRAFRRFYSWLVEEEEIEANPAARLKLPKVPVPTTRVATVDEIEALLRSCRNDKLFSSFLNRRDSALIHVLRSTGLRIAEAWRMTLDDVDIVNGLVIIPISKTRKPRIVGLDAEALRAVSKYLRALPADAEGPLWRCGNDRPLTLDGLKSVMDRRAKAAGVTITPHTLRRAFAVGWLRDGGSQASLQTLAGWNSPAMVARYVSGQAGELALDEFKRLRGVNRRAV